MLAAYYIKNQSIWSSSESLGCLGLLSSTEQNRSIGYTNWQDKQAYILGRLLLRHLLGHFCEKRVLDVIKYDAFGKPYLEGGPSFNLSHSGGYVVCAMASSLFVGIDVEECLPGIEKDLFESICTSNEWAVAKSQGLPLSLFYNIWTKKEAVLKANGKGLSVPLHQLEVMGDAPVLEGKIWYLQELPIASGYSCHLACDKPFSAPIVAELISLDILL